MITQEQINEMRRKLDKEKLIEIINNVEKKNTELLEQIVKLEKMVLERLSGIICEIKDHRNDPLHKYK